MANGYSDTTEQGTCSVPKNQRTLDCGVSCAVVHIHEPIVWAPTPPKL